MHVTCKCQPLFVSKAKISVLQRGRPAQELSEKTLGGRIRAARKAAGLSSVELGRRVGIAHQSILRSELGQTAPEKRTLILLAQELKTDFGLPWLKPHAARSKGKLLDEGETTLSFGEKEREIIQRLAKQHGRTFEEQTNELVLEALMSRRLITDRVDTNVVFLADRVPRMVSMELLGEIAAGQPIEAVPRREKVDVPDIFIKSSREQFVLRARGDSMIDEGIHDGALLVCDATNTAKNGDMVVALIDGEQATVKKFYREKTRIRLQPANKLLDPIYVDPKRLQIQGVVVGIIRYRP